SSGSGSSDDGFGDASASGNDVFIVTESQLGAQDNDTLYDLYDVRVGGVPSIPSSVVHCVGESCQGSSSFFSALSSSASESVVGMGNLVSSPSPGVSRVTSGKLSKALHACRARYNRHRRASCEASARRRYGSKAGRATRRGR